MKITQVEISHLNVSLAHATRTPIGVIDAARNVVIKIVTDSGLVGWGESSPFGPITTDSQDSNYIVAQKMAAMLLQTNPLEIDTRMAELNRITLGEPSVKSAFDMALHDIAAKAAGVPLYQYLGGAKRVLRTDLTIGMQQEVEQTLAQAQQILDAGFDAIKMKVGRQGLEDVEHVAAVRMLAGPDIAIKIDSNQGWDYPTAVANLQAMKNLNLEYSEQPLAAWDYEGLARLRDKVSMPVCADESVFNHHDALKLVKLDAVDYLNIKLGKAGGINVGLKINAIAESAKIKCMIGCFGESRLGLSAAAHLAMARPNIHFIDLDSAYHFTADPVIGGVTYDKQIGGLLHLPDVPGLGAELDAAVLENTIVVSA
ncbi:mandelate racemase/muconate lactonizing enzyme family protein [Neptunicella marina]|uniref:Dipeptide epimerase n=1 Tax=Neptunicella marina TaxID=2125989 RepID=A0A8J6M1P9_9ALTE|nr:dipeptide epimerase [Neptunicella marina]MBC3765622.1 dipeptide epimerase [Neptunicella marina]